MNEKIEYEVKDLTLILHIPYKLLHIFIDFIIN